jgi:hypothetical protein
VELMFVINDTGRALLEYEYTGVFPMVNRRVVTIKLTKEQAEQVTLKYLGQDAHRSVNETIESITCHNATRETVASTNTDA